MCGILGWVGDTSRYEFEKALHLQSHRGPDDWGYARLADNVHFGHRRLSIIDLQSHSRQPMTAGRGDLSIIFNGEIYNYLELRELLVRKGYEFRTDSDTEVLINSWHCWGVKALDRFIGMFAFAIYDHRDGSITLARDRFGIKPLYFTETSRGLGFASEPKSLLSLMPYKPSLNLTAVSSFFSFRYPVAAESFFSEIEQLPAGHFLRFDFEGRRSLHRYYRLIDHVKTKNDYNFDECSEVISEMLGSAVEYRMVADVPVGAYLSGGVDSSAIVAEMANRTSHAVQTFTIGFNEPGFEEFDFARGVSELYQTDHHEILLSQQDYLDQMDSLIRLKDAPLGVPNEVPLYLMSRELKKFITVVLSGEGADEIFGGYGRIFRSADDFGALQSLYRGDLAPNSSLAVALRRKYGDKRFTTPLEHFLYLYTYMDKTQKYDLLGEPFKHLDDESRIHKYFKEAYTESDGLSAAERMMYIFEHLHLPGLLQRVDSTTMGASVEARVPFVDHRLVELAFSIPCEYKLQWKNENARIRGQNMTGDQSSEALDIPKAVLKNALKGKLPDSVLYRRKMGFPVPLGPWLENSFYDETRSVIMKGALLENGILRKESVINLFDAARSAPAEQAQQAGMNIWQVLSLEKFVQHYF